MAKFEARDNAVFQLPEERMNDDGTGSVSIGFCVCVCGVGLKADCENANEVARCLNQDDAIKDLAAWLLKQQTLHLNKDRIELLKGIIK